MHHSGRVTAGAVLLAIVSIGSGVERPNFSGEWVLNAERTKLQVAQLAGLESATVRIDHREPTFRLWRRFVLAGQEHTVSFELMSDGSESVSGASDQRRISRLTWDGDTLVFTTRIEERGTESTNTVRYALLQQGRVLQAQERFRGPHLSYDNVWVFERSPQLPPGPA